MDNVAELYDREQREDMHAITRLIRFTEAGSLIDDLAQFCDGCKYSWSMPDRIECWMNALNTANMLIENWSLPVPKDLHIAENLITTSYKVVERHCSQAQAQQSQEANSGS
jgi:hypothetical protein